MFLLSAIAWGIIFVSPEVRDFLWAKIAPHTKSSSSITLDSEEIDWDALEKEADREEREERLESKKELKRLLAMLWSKDSKKIKSTLDAIADIDLDDDDRKAVAAEFDQIFNSKELEANQQLLLEVLKHSFLLPEEAEYGLLKKALDAEDDSLRMVALIQFSKTEDAIKTKYGGKIKEALLRTVRSPNQDIAEAAQLLANKEFADLLYVSDGERGLAEVEARLAAGNRR